MVLLLLKWKIMWINGHTRYALGLILISRLSGVSTATQQQPSPN